MIEKLIKSRDRVRNHAEVYTPEREVNAMLDLVKNETENIESRFLEPACGTGNFLAKILERKLSVVTYKYKAEQLYFERYAFIAVSSIYGIDILEDNVAECRQRLLDVFVTAYNKLYKNKANPEFINSIAYVLQKNILWGDALTLKVVDGTDKPITFAEWALVTGNNVKRRDYTLANLLLYQPEDDNEHGQVSLFSSDQGEDILIPQPVAEYPVCHYLEITSVENKNVG